MQEQIPFPNKKYSVISADCPWSYQNWTDKKNGAAKSHYSTMSLDEICSLPVADLADDNCALNLWATWPKLPEALKVIDAWGFKFKTGLFVWNKVYNSGKPYCGLGFYTRSASEFCLLGLKGRMTPKLRSVRQVITAPVGKHSVKPNEVYQRIEQLWDGPYIELFAREKRDGWDVWGNEV